MKLQRRITLWLLAAACVIFAAKSTHILWAAAPEDISPDGTVLIRELSVPLSSYLSPEARSYMIHLLRDHPFFGGPSAAEDIKGYRARQDEIMNGFLGPSANATRSMSRRKQSLGSTLRSLHRRTVCQPKS